MPGPFASLGDAPLPRLAAMPSSAADAARATALAKCPSGVDAEVPVVSSSTPADIFRRILGHFRPLFAYIVEVRRHVSVRVDMHVVVSGMAGAALMRGNFVCHKRFCAGRVGQNHVCHKMRARTKELGVCEQLRGPKARSPGMHVA